MDASSSGEVVLAEGSSASTLLHRILGAAVDAHPQVFEGVDIGESVAIFKNQYAEILPQFEAARADSKQRLEIAGTLLDAAASCIVWHADADEVPLREHLAAPAEALKVETKEFSGTGTLRPTIECSGTALVSDELVSYAEALVNRGSASTSVADAVAWVVHQAGGAGLDLRGRRVALLGAAAELAPARLWLQGGADVLWIDVAPPPVELVDSHELAGSIQWAPEGGDLLARPGAVRATIEQFAAGERIDLGLYAYAPGKTREWRLAAAMNAIVDALPPETVGSIATLVSASTCGVLTDEELSAEQRRREERPRWQAAFDAVGLLGKGPGHAGHGATCTNRGIVPIQGSSYQAAQYLGKLLATEVWASGEQPPTISANTAGISRTASMNHPVFNVAFAGAAALGVETFEPATTASLNGLLTLRDLLDPAAANVAPGAVTSTRVHGGVYEMPYPMEPTLRAATLVGVAKDPRRLAAILRR